MRGADVTQESLFSYQGLGDYVPQAHPLRPIREIVNAALREMDRLIEHEVVRELFEGILDRAKAKGLLSCEHFSVDGTLIRAWASHKRFVPKDGAPPPSAGSRGNPEVDFKGQKRTNDTHESRTDPDSRLYTKSSKAGAIPCYMGHVLTENRNGLVVDTRLTQARGTAEREAALEMLAALPGEARKTVGADKAYDIEPFVQGCRELKVTPHVAQNTSGRSSRIDQRTTRHPGYGLSQYARKLIETVFGDAKQHGILRQVKLRGRAKVELLFTLAATVVNLRRLPRLLAMHPSG